jgi:hypothetical protein
MGVGDGSFVTWNGTTWSAASSAPAAIISVSCLSASFCIAEGSGSYIWTGVSWSPTAVNPGGGPVSCPSASFCAEAYHDAVVTWNGTVWSARAVIDRAYFGLDDISCPSASFCAAVDSGGFAFTTTGT